MHRLERTLLAIALAVLVLAHGTHASLTRGSEALLPLQISESRRFLTTSDGKPFFWLADTGWLLFHRLTPPEVDLYLKDRAAKGFTVIQTMIVGTDDEFKVSDSFGGMAFEEGDPGRPNETYFRHVDAVVAKANSLGLRVAIAPTWANHVRKKGPHKGSRVFDAKHARDYGEFVGRRYRDAAVVWIVGGDCLVEQGDTAIWRALAEGLRSGGDGRHLLTGHFREGSSHYFHKEPWLDFNFAYSGHVWAAPSYKDIRRDRELIPTKPVIDGEPIYENHPYLAAGKPYYRNKKAWDGKRRGDAHQVREAAYWAMLAGAAGHSYGAHDVWQMYDPEKRAPKNHANTPWYEALDFHGATQMGIMRRFFESFDWQELVPDQSMISCEQGKGEHHVQAARAGDGSFLMAYLPMGDPVSIRLDVISPKAKCPVIAQWFDPRYGTWSAAGRFKNSGIGLFTPPSRGTNKDWVLVLQSEDSANRRR